MYVSGFVLLALILSGGDGDINDGDIEYIFLALLWGYLLMGLQSFVYSIIIENLRHKLGTVELSLLGGILGVGCAITLMFIVPEYNIIGIFTIPAFFIGAIVPHIVGKFWISEDYQPLDDSVQ